MTITTFCRNASILSAFGLIAFVQPAAAQTATGTMDATANVSAVLLTMQFSVTFAVASIVPVAVCAAAGCANAIRP
ncbi:MAG: hypothetical protein EOP67_52340, partial [Sphingomonas sp.]